MNYFFNIIAFLMLVTFVNAQDYNPDATLLSINNDSFKANEFVENYNKNIDIVVDDSQKDVSHYLDLFIDYQLKLKAAKNMGLDTSQVFLKEYNRYYKQLADNYIANGDITEAMLKETYDRMITEVKARHILLSIESDKPEDTLQAYQKAVAIKAQINKGKNFEDLASEVSSDPSAKQNGGDLGWFNAFKMVYDFETAAYALKLNEVSDPVRTQFGYHIIQKTGERASKGKIKIAHIMVSPQSNDTTSNLEARINEIYKLTKTEDFSDLAKQYSTDENSAKNGGELPYFAVGGLNDKNIENTAFELTDIGEVSKPVRSRFGWHILKLLEVKGMPSFESQKEEIRRQVKTSSRAKLINKKISKELQDLYQPYFTRNHFILISDEITDFIETSKFRIDSIKNKSLLSEKFLHIQDEHFTYKDYFEYLESNQRSYINKKSVIEVVKASKNDYLYDKLIKYHRKNLININPDFAKSVKTFREGILLFEVMEQQVWNPMSLDSLAQQNYYAEHKDEYLSKTSAELKIFSSSDKSVLKAHRKAYKAFKTQKKDSVFISNQDAVISEKGIFTKASPKMHTSFFKSEGVSKIKKLNNTFVYVDVEKLNLQHQLKLEEVRGKIISHLQKQREEEWLKDLRAKYDIDVNTTLLKKIEASLEK